MATDQLQVRTQGTPRRMGLNVHQGAFTVGLLRSNVAERSNNPFVPCPGPPTARAIPKSITLTNEVTHVVDEHDVVGLNISMDHTF